MAEQTFFFPGSGAKLFTCTAVIQLAQQGRLALDADINDYLDFTIPATLYPRRANQAAETITLAHLRIEVVAATNIC